MLVLSRKLFQSIYLKVPPTKEGEEARQIQVQIVGIGGNLVKVGIEADRDIAILREELLDKEPEKIEVMAK